ncbi:MAG: AarF/ABC1/UbiB kinase family protein, partial [Planococcus donghaensis]
MIYFIMLLELLVIGLFIYYVSGRLMGSKVNFTKRILSVLLGVSLTTFVYWYSYLRHTDFLSEGIGFAVADASAIIWVGSMLLISMLFYLFFELIDPMELGERGERITGQK